MTTLDPYEHAQDLGVTIYFRPMPRWKGLWFHDQRVMVLRENMDEVEERRALTACLAHAFEAGHSHDQPACSLAA